MQRFADLFASTNNNNDGGESSTKKAKTASRHTANSTASGGGGGGMDGGVRVMSASQTASRARALALEAEAMEDDKPQATFVQKGIEQRKHMVQQMRDVAVLLDKRRIVPEDESARRELMANELALLPTRSAASISTFRPLQGVEVLQETSTALRSVISKNNGAHYDLLEFADMLSERTHDVSAGGGASKSARAPGNASATHGIHTHEPRQTLFKSIEHSDEYKRKFVTDERFEYALFDAQSNAYGSLVLCPQHDSAEIFLESLRLEMCARAHNTAPTVRTTSEWSAYITKHCGLRFFCAYVSGRDARNVCLLFSADGSDRFFLVFVLETTSLPDTCIKMAAKWDEEAEKLYRECMEDTKKARETFRPCAARFDSAAGGAQQSFWALYTPTMCPTFNTVTCTFSYAYYTACQCVEMIENK